MRLNFPHEVANRIIDLAFVFRENGMAERVVERDPMWESAIAESLSTVGRNYVDRIRQSYQTLDAGGGRTMEMRDPLSGQRIVKCDPTCTYPPCATARQVVQSFYGRPNTHCSGCLECTLMEGN